MALGDNLVAYWTFDGNANDSVGSDNGSVTGATNTTGLINNGYSFDGSGDYLYNTSVPEFEMAAFSLMAWVKPDTSAASCYILNFGKPINSPYYGWVVSLSASNAISFFSGKSGGYNNITTTGVLTDNVWNMVIITFSGTEARIYINDNAVETTGSLGAISYNSSYRKFNIGRIIDYTPAPYWMDGMIDEVGIWNRVLTADEVEELYNSGDGLQYPFGGASASTISKINGVSYDSIAKINGVSKASVSKVNGVSS